MNAQEYVLVFNQEGSGCRWVLTLDTDEKQGLEIEIEHYNTWINTVLAGLAPDTSYLNGDANSYYMAKSQNKCRYYMDNRPGNRSYYESPHISFELMTRAEADEENPGSASESIQTLVDILTHPLGDEEFSMGYRLLPVTTKIVAKLRLLQVVNEAHS